ncbi:MAG TPA: patatin-like phospholipase family protein [Candidatus Binatia bacterium]|nr:patatin-like phospholipase family protein [Candidatus Binatia bacterium]
MNPLPVDPWNFALPEYLLGVSVAPADLHPNYTEENPSEFYQDDQHITAAGLQLHPLLGKEAVDALLDLLPWPASVRDMPADARLTELRDETDGGIHLLLSGRARIVATDYSEGHPRRWVVGQCRTGQWIGLPELLRQLDRSERRWLSWPDRDIRVHVEALGPLRTQRLALDDALALMRAQPDFRRFVEHHVAVRFARRREMVELMDENPFLRLLNPADREYLLELGALVTVDETTTEPYLAAGPPSGRAALIVRGEAALLLPGDGGGVRYGATLRPGDLVGHEGLLMEAELRDPDASSVEIVEPPRTTEVRLAPATQVLQLYWYALRWVLDNRTPVWDRAKAILSGGRSGIAAPLPTIVTFQAARPGLGTTVLAYGTAAALASSSRRTVVVLDVQGAENFAAHWQPCGFDADRRPVSLQSGPRQLRATNRTTSLDCQMLVPRPGVPWPADLKVIWPETAAAGHVEDLVDAIEADQDVSHIIVAGRDRPGEGESLMTQVLERLHGRCDAVFYVCDDSGAVFGREGDAEPEHLTWIYRMTPAYLAAERRHAGRVRFDWFYAGILDTVPDAVRGAVEGYLGWSPTAELERESLQGPRRVVRVPDDAVGAKIFDRGGVGELVGPGAERLALGRAFARLARVVDGCTVGLALGGGGAWGFSHVALLRNLEADGVPIDYIAGTSFGSVVGGLYAAGGMRALDLLIEGNSAMGQGIGATLRALAGGTLNRALFGAPFSSAAIENFVNEELRTVGVGSFGQPPCLGATEIPFYPVGTNLGTHEPIALPHATVGFGVQMSGSLPPIFPSLLRRWDRIGDGAFVANVPSRVVREVGAHFVISANVVPPPPVSQRRTLARSIVTWLPRKIAERIEDTLRGVFVLAWKAGEDQGALAADYALDLRPTAANLFEMWRGRDIADEIEAKHFAGENAHRIREAWDRFRGRRNRT